MGSGSKHEKVFRWASSLGMSLNESRGHFGTSASEALIEMDENVEFPASSFKLIEDLGLIITTHYQWGKYCMASV